MGGETVTQETGSTTLYFGPWYRKSPYFEASRRAGASAFDVYNHMYLPAYYDDPVTEYWAVVDGVTVWDVAAERNIEITGPDALRFTNLLTPRDLTKVAPGRGRYVVITAEDGGIVNDPVLLRVDADRFWLAAADSDLLLWAKGVAVFAQMDVEIREPDASPMQIQGPRSKDVLRALFGEEPLQLGYYHCMRAELDGIPLVISRTGWSAEIGYELYLLDASRGSDLWERVFAAGAPYGVRPVAPVEARRIEAGIFNYGSDMTLENNPFEVTGLERMVEADKEGDYIGRKALERIRQRGVQRKLVGIHLPGEPLPAENTEHWPVFHDGTQVGHVTAAIFSPRLERNIGYVWVPIGLSEAGTPLQVRTEHGETREGITSGLPFLDPAKAIPRG